MTRTNPSQTPGPLPGHRRPATAVSGHVLLVLVVCFGLFPGAFAPGRDLAPSDGLYAFSPWREEAPGRVPSNPLLGDVVTQFLPWDRLVQQALAKGRIPLWNPYNACGQPLLGNWQSAVFYPFSLLARCLPHPYLVKALLKLICCQLAMFGFLRRLPLGVAGSFAGACLFTFCGFNVVWLAHPHSNVSVLLPLVFYCWARFLREGRGLFFALTAVTVALQLFGGHPETAFHCGFFVLVFTVFFSPQDGPGRKGRAVLLLVGAYLLGLLLAAVQVLPSLEYLARSTALFVRSAAASADPYFSSQIQDGEGWMGLVAPGLFGSPLSGNWVGPVNFNEIAGGFVGWSGLFLALMWGLSSGHRQRPAFVAMLFFCLAGAFRLPGLEPLFSLFPLSILDCKRMLLGAAFALAVLGGMGADTLGREVFAKKALRRKAWGFLGAVCCLLAAHGFLSARPLASLHPLRVALAQGAIFIAGFLVLVPVFRRRSKTAGTIVVACILGNLVLFGAGYIPAAKTGTADMPASVEKRLRAETGSFRTVSLESGFLPADTNVFSDVFLLTGYDAVGIRTYDAFLKAVAPFPFHPVFHQLHWRPPPGSPWLDFLNVGNVVTPGSVTLSGGGYRDVSPVAQRAAYHIYRNDRRLPRAFLVDRVKAVADVEKTLAAVRDGFDPRAAVMLPVAKDLRFPVRHRETDRCRITGYAPERIDLRVEHTEPRVLVLSEAWYPGWRATVDGRETKILRANGAFRALLLTEPGPHEIVMTYEPESFRMGGMISAGTFLSMVGFGILRKRRGGRGRRIVLR